jgi:hypothetical protein
MSCNYDRKIGARKNGRTRNLIFFTNGSFFHEKLHIPAESIPAYAKEKSLLSNNGSGKIHTSWSWPNPKEKENGLPVATEEPKLQCPSPPRSRRDFPFLQISSITALLLISLLSLRYHG